jgi:HEAT repeat protein
VRRGVLAVVLIGACAAAGLWQYRRLHQAQTTGETSPDVAAEDGWVDLLYSQNPREVEAASQRLTDLGAGALPVIRGILRDPQSEAERLKAALKACGILGKIAAPLIPDVAAVLPEPGLTAEAAIALSYMGRDAFGPLRDALSSDDPVVRREALRSIGKLKERAPLDLDIVLPLLTAGMEDADPGVRAVAATYLGIIHEGAAEAVPALVGGLSDPDPEVRRASAAALGSFGAEAVPALPALKKAASDQNDDVAREAGRSLVKLQPK